MTFFVNGVETPVIVDDFFPCYEESGKPQCASSEEGELWVMLLEKGWAKLHGSYARIEHGWSTHVSTHLTGLPSQPIDNREENAEMIWKRLRDPDSCDFAIQASVLNEEDMEEEEEEDTEQAP